MAYVDIDDIRTEYLPDAEGVTDTALETFALEEEAYVANRLGDLPPDNAIVYTIIRDFVIARAILTLLPIQSRDTTLAELTRKEATRRLNQAEEDGIGVGQTKSVNTGSVYTPLGDGLPFFTLDDFELGTGVTPYDPFF